MEVTYEGTSFVDIILNWDTNGPLNVHLEPENTHILQLMISWFRVARKTPADYHLYPKFPFKINIDKHCNFSIE